MDSQISDEAIEASQFLVRRPSHAKVRSMFPAPGGKTTTLDVVRTLDDFETKSFVGVGKLPVTIPIRLGRRCDPKRSPRTDSIERGAGRISDDVALAP